MPCRIDLKAFCQIGAEPNSWQEMRSPESSADFRPRALFNRLWAICSPSKALKVCTAELSSAVTSSRLELPNRDRKSKILRSEKPVPRMACAASASVVKASRKGPAESHANSCPSFPCRRYHSDQSQTLFCPSSIHKAGHLDDRPCDASCQAGFCRSASGASPYAAGQNCSVGGLAPAGDVLGPCR